MRQTLFYIPTEIFGVPLFRFGVLFWAVLLFFLWRILRGLLAAKRSDDWASDLVVGAIALVIVALVAPSLDRGSGLPVRGYGVFLMLGIVAASIFAIVRGRKLWNIPPELIISIVVVEVVSGILGARIFYVAEYWRSFIIADPGSGIDWRATVWNVLNLTQGGLVVFGSIIGGILTTLIYLRMKRLPLLATMDIFAPALMIGIAIGRIGCFMNGCCFGGVCDAVPPGVVFPAASPSHYYQMEHGLVSLGGFNLFVPEQDGGGEGETLFHLKGKDEGLMAPSRGEPIMVESVDQGSAPDLAGLKPGMTILRAGVVVPLKGEPTSGEIDRAAMYSLVGTRGFLSLLYDNGFPTRFPYLVLDVTDPPAEDAREPAAESETADTETAESETTGEAGAEKGEDKAESAPPKPHRIAFHPGPFEVRAVHPTQLYSSAVALLLALFLCLAGRFVRKDGFVFGLMLVCYPVCRFLIELFRTDEPSFAGTGLSVSQCVSVFVLVIGLGIILCSLTRKGPPAFEGIFPPEGDEAET